MLDKQYEFDENGIHTSQAEWKHGTDVEPDENMIIHGDNLYALKALLPKYEGKVDCIYIDPPYNTGKEGWVYNDNVNDPFIRKWLGKVVGDDDLSRHDKWLCMMYPRLQLMKDLLSPAGTIFISISDIEAFNLKLMCDEIFGSNNFITDVIWEKSDSPKMDSDLFTSKSDHTLVYAKNKSVVRINLVADEEIGKQYDKVDENGRIFYLKPLRAMGKDDARSDRENMYYPIQAPDGTLVYPIRTDGTDGRWRWSLDKLNAEINRISWIKGKKGWTPYYRIYAPDVSCRPPETIFYHNDVGSNRTAVTELKTIFDGQKPFETPKPLGLIEKILEIATNKDSIVLDAFAGAGTTGHATMISNQNDGGNRHFIMIEMMDYCETLTSERIKRAINGYRKTPGIPTEFSKFKVGQPLFKEDKTLNESLDFEKIRNYVWFMETRTSFKPTEVDNPYFMGKAFSTSYWFYYEKEQKTVLDVPFFESIDDGSDSYVIYADACTLPRSYMDEHNINFKKIPREIPRL